MEITVRDEPDPGRYVAEMNGEVAGFTEYHLRPHDVFFFIHTEVDPKYQGRGIGNQLAAKALTDVRRRGGRIVPLCPFIAKFVRTHPDYDDLVDHQIWDRIKARHASETAGQSNE